MKQRAIRNLSAGLLLGWTLVGLSLFAGDSEAKLKKVAEGVHREAKNSARDSHRHPLETLMFFGIEDDMTVVEITPAGGWYTEILAPFLKGSGTYVAAGYNQNPSGRSKDYFTRVNKQFHEKFVSHPEIYGEFTVKELALPDKKDIGEPGTADMVLSFRNLHNWVSNDSAKEMGQLFYDVLKPGGVLGITDHRGKAGSEQDPTARSGYVNEDYVIELFQSVGFKLAAKSEINANAKDTKDHPRGVWTLPPSFALGEENRDKYAAIGESDRWTLKFVKPEN